MHKLCRVDIAKSKRVYQDIEIELRRLAKTLRERFNASTVIVYGSYVHGSLHEGSDIDMLIVGDFEGKFHKRIAEVLDMTWLPIEPLCYTADEFAEMIKSGNSLLKRALEEGITL